MTQEIQASSFLRQRALCSHSEGVSSPRARECFTLGDFHWQYTRALYYHIQVDVYGFTHTQTAHIYKYFFMQLSGERWAQGIDSSPGALQEANHYSCGRAKYGFMPCSALRAKHSQNWSAERERNWLVSYNWRRRPHASRLSLFIAIH